MRISSNSSILPSASHVKGTSNEVIMTLEQLAAKGVRWYLALAFGLAWIAWFLVWMSGPNPAHLAQFQLAVLPGAFAPAAAAWIVRKFITREGFSDLRSRASANKWGYFLFALVLPQIAVVVILGMNAMLGLSVPDFSLQRALRALGAPEVVSAPHWFWFLAPFVLLVQSTLYSPVLWGEEFGWRGYLQMRLCSGQPVRAAIYTGLIWGVWHYPLLLMGYQYPDHPLLGLLVFPVTTTLLSIIFGWLRQASGTLWTPILAHSATNATGGSLTLLLFFGGPNWIFVCYAGLLAWVPLAVVCAWIISTKRLVGINRLTTVRSATDESGS
jgi:membrane protease YdiL (CAAX protease family)